MKIGDRAYLNKAALKSGHFVIDISSFEELESWYIKARAEIESHPKDTQDDLRCLTDNTLRYYSLILQSKNI